MTSRRIRSTALGYTLPAHSPFGVVTFLLLPMLVVASRSLHRWDVLGPIEVTADAQSAANAAAER